MNLPILSALAFAGLGPFLGGSQGVNAGQEAPTSPEKPAIAPDEAKSVWEYLSGRYDANGDGKVAKDEYTRGAEQFARLDKDKSGFIEEADCKQASGRGGGRGGGRGRGGKGGGRSESAPTEGSVAPDFELETLYPVKEEGAAQKTSDKPSSKAEKPVTFESAKLSSWKGKKPVALIFGSYT